MGRIGCNIGTDAHEDWNAGLDVTGIGDERLLEAHRNARGIGFRATDEDEQETPPNVVDGRADETEREPSMAEQCDIFHALCTAMRAMGATEIRMGGFRATFPPQLTPQRAMPASAREPRETKSDDDKLPRLDGDGPEDDARRRRYSEMARVIAG